MGKAPTDYQQQPDALPIADILQKLEAAAKAGETVEEAPPEEPKTPTPPPGMDTGVSSFLAAL